MNYPSDLKTQTCIGSSDVVITGKECRNKQDVKICSPDCKYFLKEKYSSVDFGLSKLTEVGRGKVVTFGRDVFIPNMYECIVCSVSNLELSVIDLTKIEIDISFKLKSRVNRDISTKEVYEIDKWKLNSVEMETEYVPLLGVYTLNDEPVKVVGGKYRIDNRDEKIKRIGNIINTWMPYAKAEQKPISVKGMPEFEGQDYVAGIVCEGEHFIGRNNCLYGKLYLEKEYSMTIECRYEREKRKNMITELLVGLLFPFPIVNYESFSIGICEELDLLPESEMNLVVPTTEKVERLFMIPLEGNTNNLAGGGFIKVPFDKTKEAFYYDKYLILMNQFKLKIKDDIIISSKWNDMPIALSVYNSINKLYEGKFAPVKVIINNNGSQIRKLRILFSIEGITTDNSREVELKVHEEKVFFLAPVLLEEKIKEVTEITNRICKVQIFTRHGECIWNDTKEVEVWPRETFLHEIKNDGDDWQIDLNSYIARWVTPHAKCVERIVANAGIGNSMSGIYAKSQEKMLYEIKAIYDEISQDIRYVTRSLSYADEGKGQRVCLPSLTMSLKSGNCIDLTVLLTSCLEALRYDVYIAFIKGHAFLKVKFSENYYECIEATDMGKFDFAVALSHGRIIYDENFESDGTPKKEGNILVEIKLSRKSNILPME